MVFSPNVLVGIVLGAAVVFMFSGLAVNAVSRAAGAVVYEVRRQFHANPGIMDGTVRPEYGRVVDICTRDSLRELATPGLLAVLAPIAVGFGLGIGPLAGYLAGAIATGTLMAVFLANSGGAWDNAKKLVEDGNHGGKGSDAHEATIIGDTVGDPFKDTAGPAINPLIKVMNLVSLLIAPAIVTFSIGEDANTGLRVAIAVVAFAADRGAPWSCPSGAAPRSRRTRRTSRHQRRCLMPRVTAARLRMTRGRAVRRGGPVTERVDHPSRDRTGVLSLAGWRSCRSTPQRRTGRVPAISQVCCAARAS